MCVFDPLLLLSNENIDENELKEQGEDVFQISYSTITIDLGWYRTSYKLMVVINMDWENPAESYRFKNGKSAIKKFKNLLSRYGLLDRNNII
jgi:hypothetical protein